MKAQGTFSVKKWEEKTYDQISSNMKMTKATVEYAFAGGITGKASVEYVMCYTYVDPSDQHQSSAVYVGLINFTGTIEGKEGSFVMEDTGAFNNGTASSVLNIVGGSGSGALKKIAGTGIYRANQQDFRIELEYSL